jgi:hypothetical protein
VNLILLRVVATCSVSRKNAMLVLLLRQVLVAKLAEWVLIVTTSRVSARLNCKPGIIR